MEISSMEIDYAMKNQKDTRPMNYIDLFSGCGGLSLGLYKAGIRGIFAVEKDDDAFKTLQHNMIDERSHFDWPEWLPQKAHDINSILKEHIDDLLTFRGKIDLLAGGPPCQGFSLAGRRNSADRRNKLVHSYIKMVETIQPTFIFLENVKGFTIPFSKNGETKQYSSDVVKKLTEIGYFVNHRLIDFAEYGVPQHRTRFVLIGVRKKKDIDNNFAQLFFSKIELLKTQFLTQRGLTVPVSVKDAIDDILHSNGTYKCDSFPKFQFGVYAEAQTAYQKLMRTNSGADNHPDSHRFANHGPVVKKRFAHAIESQMTPAEYRTHFKLKKSSTKRLIEIESTPTLTTLPDDYIHYSEPRILTVREYARIQSFPDDFIFLGKYTTGGKRRTCEVPRYSQIGNAIPPLFGEIAGMVFMQLHQLYLNSEVQP